jgi:hypothetical protein
MFSTVDARRFLAFSGEGAEERPVELPEELEDAAERVEALPSEGWVRALAAALAADPALAGKALRAEVWEARYDASMRPQPRRLAGVVVPAQRGGR